MKSVFVCGVKVMAADKSLFFYVTYKLVLLKDKRLGVLYYVLALLALLYTVVEIFIKKGYMDVRNMKSANSFGNLPFAAV